MSKDNSGVRPRSDGGLARYLRGELSGTELLTRTNVSNITIILTYRCPASCDHCVFACHSERSDVVDPEAAFRLIQAAAQQAPPPTVSFSGGEPFTQLPLMKELAAFASSKGMISEVISSCAWCKDPQHTASVLEDLKNRGLRTFCTSVDEFHLNFVDAGSLRTGIVTALATGLRVVVNVASSAAGPRPGPEYLEAALALPRATAERCEIHPITVAPVGRAARNIHDFAFSDKDLREGCPFATEIVTLTPNGFLFPCCGMVLGEECRDAGLFTQDDLRQKTVEEIVAALHRTKADVFYRLLQAAGPYALLMAVKQRFPSLRTRERFVGSCDVCLEFTKPNVAKALRTLLLNACSHLEES